MPNCPDCQTPLNQDEIGLGQCMECAAAQLAIEEDDNEPS